MDAGILRTTTIDLAIYISTRLLVDIHSFIYSFIHTGYFYSASWTPYTTTQRRSRHSTDTVPEFHAEAPQATVSEELAQGPYLAARAGDEPMTPRTKGVDSTNAPSTDIVLLHDRTLSIVTVHMETLLSFSGGHSSGMRMKGSFADVCLYSFY